MPLQTQDFWVLGHQRRDFDGCIYIRYAAPPYSAVTVIMARVYRGRVKPPALFFVIWHSYVKMRS